MHARKQLPTAKQSPPLQGDTCVEISATYDTSRVVTSPDYTQHYQALGETTVFSRKVGAVHCALCAARACCCVF